MEKNDSSIAVFTGLGHGVFHGFELSIPLFVPIWLSTFDVSPTTLGLVVGAGYALIGLFAPIAGVLADVYGSKRLVLLSTGGMGLSFATLSVLHSVVTLTVTLMIWGAMASLYHPSGLSLISRGAEKRGTVLAYHGAGGNVGMVVVPLAAIVLLAFYGWRTVTVLLTVPAAICVLVGLGVSFDETVSESASQPRDPDRSSLQSISNSLRDVVGDTRTLLVGGFVLVFAIQILYGIYYRGIFTFLPDVLTNLPIFEAVVVGDRTIEAGQFAYSGLLLVGIFGQYTGGKVSDRGSSEQALLGTFIALIIASALFVPASTVGVGPLLIVCVALGFFIYAFAPIAQSLVAEYVAAESHGLSFGYIYLGMFGVGAVGAALAGATLEYGGVAALFGTLATVMVLCAALAGVLVFRSPS
ncbi:MFS transporter [Natrinema caseinilyticum]|uniref:MFS transporter n=1 Tax=Natrinema caseinilyticum TaxID=2961570 RepID=UPI0020C30A0B|nr:MFS transporter [Natrinema caseinilyticum]